MLKQRTLKNTIKTTGVGLHTGRAGRDRASPGGAQRRHRFPPRRPRASGRDPRGCAARRRDASVLDAQARRRRDLHRRAHDVRARRTGDRQRPHRRLRPRDPDHGRQRRSVRVPAAVGRNRRAGRGQALSADRPDGRGCATATSGRGSSRSTASSSISRSISRTRCSGPRTATSSSTSPSIRT